MERDGEGGRKGGREREREGEGGRGRGEGEGGCMRPTFVWR